MPGVVPGWGVAWRDAGNARRPRGGEALAGRRGVGEPLARLLVDVTTAAARLVGGGVFAGGWRAAAEEGWHSRGAFPRSLGPGEQGPQD